MLTIRAEQLAAFESEFSSLRDQRLADYARTRFPERFQTRTPEQMSRFCQATRAIATEMGLEEEPDVATVLDLIVMYGPRFRELDWVSQVLDVQSWSGPQKLDELRRRVRRTVPEF